MKFEIRKKNLIKSVPKYWKLIDKNESKDKIILKYVNPKKTRCMELHINRFEKGYIRTSYKI